MSLRFELWRRARGDGNGGHGLGTPPDYGERARRIRRIYRRSCFDLLSDYINESADPGRDSAQGRELLCRRKKRGQDTDMAICGSELSSRLISFRATALAATARGGIPCVRDSGAPLSINDTEKPVQLSRRKQRRQQITAALDRLANTFPQTFFVYGAHRKPLKIGIANDIAATGAIPPEELRWVLRSYCGATGYFRSCKEGATRVDLAGNEAGIVTADEAEYAREKLAAVLARRQPQPTAASHGRRTARAGQSQ